MVRDKRSTSRAGSQESTRGSDENKVGSLVCPKQ